MSGAALGHMTGCVLVLPSAAALASGAGPQPLDASVSHVPGASEAVVGQECLLTNRRRSGCGAASSRRLASLVALRVLADADDEAAVLLAAARRRRIAIASAS
jgi:hypothetical protein